MSAAPMEIEEAPRSKGLPAHIKRLRAVDGCGAKKLQILAGAFPTAAALSSATEKDFLKLAQETRGIGAPLAKKLFNFSRDGAEAAALPPSERRIPMWNKMTKKKVCGAAAPRESEVEEWLARRAAEGADYYERFNDQDLQQKGPNAVPEDDLIDGPEFQTFWSRSAGMQLDQAKQALSGPLAPYALKPLEGRLPAPGSLISALLHAATFFDADPSTLRAELHKTSAAATPEAFVLQLIDVAQRMLKRPVWAFACTPPTAVGAAGSSTAEATDVKVFINDPEDSDDPAAITPVRLALIGGLFFALVGLEQTAAVDVEEDPAAELEPAQLPDIKDDVDSLLADVLAGLDEVEKWSRTELGEAYDFSTASGQINNLRKRLKHRNGEAAAFLGVGKSFIINTLVMNSSVDEATYKTQPRNYVPEALLNLWSTSSSNEPPSFHELLTGTRTGRHDVTVTLLQPDGDFTTAAHGAKLEYGKMEDSVKRFCEKGGDKPQIKRYVLPCGDASRSTTALHTRVRYGQVVQLLVEYYSEDDLKKNAFTFVQLMRNYADEGTELRSLSDIDMEGLEEAWHVYLSVKRGLKRADLPRKIELYRLEKNVEQLEASWQDIVVVQAMKDLIRSPMHVFLGTGKSLHLDRIMVHDLIEKMNDKEQLDRYAVKSVETYQPAGVLENGNEFLDLPGLNDVDTGCTAQTREGIKEAGVIFVVLSKSLFEDKDSLKMLKQSDTIKRAAAGEANVVFLFNREPLATFSHRQLETQAEMDVREKLERQTREIWEKELQEANDLAEVDGETYKTEQEIKELAQNTRMRTIYPMLHTSFKLNWEFAEAHKATEGDLSGSDQIFARSNVPFLLGILETLNRNSVIEQLKQIATIELPTLREKLKASLADAKNAEGGLPELLIQKAAEFLKGKRTISGALNMQADLLNNNVERLSSTAHADAATSFLLHIDSYVAQYIAGEEVATRVEVSKYLEGTRRGSDARWTRMSKAMKRMQQGTQAIDPRNKGNALGFSLLPMIFGHNSRKAPVDFTPLKDEIEVQLDAMLEKVVDLVIKNVEDLLKSVLGSERCPSMAMLKESFIELDVIKPLKQRGVLRTVAKLLAHRERFSLKHFVKVRQRDPMLNDGKLDHYLQKYAAKMGFEAIKETILSRASDQHSLTDIKNLIEHNRERAREVWRDLMQSGLQDFFGEQFRHLQKDLTNPKNKKAFSLKAMLTAFLQHIVNTHQMSGNVELQNDLSGFIKDLEFKTDSLHPSTLKASSRGAQGGPPQSPSKEAMVLPRSKRPTPHSSTRHSLWARLDGQDNPDQLGAAAARHVERRLQRELTLRKAYPAAVMLGQPNRVMAVTHLEPDHQRLERLFKAGALQERKDIFISSDEEAIQNVRVELRERYNLDVFQRGDCDDLFSSVVLVTYKQHSIIGKTGKADEKPTLDEALPLAAAQLRTIAAAQIAHHYRTEQRCQEFEKIIGEKLGTYVDKVRSVEYRGDLLCLFFLANHFQRPFRVWLPGVGSILITDPSGPSTRFTSALAFQLMLVAADAPGKDYKPQWLPVQLKRSQINHKRDSARAHAMHLQRNRNRFEALETTDDESLPEQPEQPEQREQPTSGAKGKKRARFQ